MRRKYLAAAVALVIAAGMMFGGAWAQDQENRDLFSVYLQCRDRGDEAGMAAALDAMEDAGEYLYAFRGIAESEEPDVPRLAALYDRLTEPGYIALNRSEFRHINESGRLEYYNLYIGALLEKLLGMEDEEAAALAARIADNIVAECRPIIEEGRQRSRPYTALGELKSRAGALWTDELQELMESCVAMPENGVLTDKNGLQAEPGSEGTATVTVQNKSTTKGAVLQLRRTVGSPSGVVNVFAGPDSSFAVTVLSGNYEAYVWQGQFWYGSDEYFGNPADRRTVEIYDGIHHRKTSVLDGIALITVN